MIIGVLTVELQVPGAQSLKDKRQVIQSLTAHLRRNFNLAVAQVDHLDSWQLATLGLACVSTDLPYAQGLLQQAIDYIGRQPGALILEYSTEYL